MYAKQYREVTKMTNDIIQECCNIIDEHCEADYETYSVGYFLSYEDNKIKFARVTSYPNGETYSDGGIDKNYSISILLEEDATLRDYTNIAIKLLNTEEDYLRYKYGEDVFAIQMRRV